MKRLTLIIITIFTLFGCADDNNLIQPVPYIPDNDTNINNDDNNTITDNNTGTDIIDNKPVADFNYTVNGTTIYLQDLSEDDNGIVRWEWKTMILFQNQIIGNKPEVEYTFTIENFSGGISGIYEITLTVYDENNQSSSITKEIAITDIIVDFDYITNNYDNYTVSFIDNSRDEDFPFLGYPEKPDLWEWDFGDGNKSDLQNPKHTYEKSGIYDVTLKISTINGAVSYITKQVIVGHPDNIDLKPIANFDFRIDGYTIDLLDTSIDDTGITSWEWVETVVSKKIINLGPGMTSISTTSRDVVISNEQNILSYELSPDDYGYYGALREITLTVLDETGQKSTITKTVPMTGLTASFDYIIDKYSVKFTDSSKDISKGTKQDKPIKWEWDFGDKNTSNENNPTHIYTDSGDYEVKLIVYAPNGASSSYKYTIHIN